MNLIERAKRIITTPKTEWFVIDNETATPGSLLVSYVLPMAIISSLGALIAGLLGAGYWGIQYYVVAVLISFVSIILSYYFASYVLDMLAPSFNSEKNINKSAQLIAYSNTPTWIAGFLSFIPFFGWLIMVAAWIYSVYLMYLGVGPLKKTPEDKKVIYILITFIVMLVIGSIIAALLHSIFSGMMGYGYGLNRLGY